MVKWTRNADTSSLVHILRDRARLQPDQRAYTFLVDGITERDSLTYGQLDRQSREIGSMLRRVLEPGDRALLMYAPGLDFVSAFFGCLVAGIIAVPVYPPQPTRPERSLPRLISIQREAQARAILCTEDSIENLAALTSQDPSLADCPLLATDHYGIEDIEGLQAADCQPTSIAFLQYTSGSTAAPKGVVVSHGNILHNLATIRQVSFHPTPNVLVSWLPTYHDMGLFSGVLFPLFNDCPVYLMSPVSFLQKPVRWLEAISHFRGTNSGAPNFAFDLCVQRTTVEQRRLLDLSSWQVAFNGAEPIQASTLDRFWLAFRDSGFKRSALYPVYGLAESTVFVSGKALEEHPPNPHLASSTSPSAIPTNVVDAVTRPTSIPVSCGTPQCGMEVIIVDPQHRVQKPALEVGEIWVRGPSVAQGYWRQADETQRTFEACLATGQGPYLRTGDLGYIHDDQLYVTGRIKDLIIVRGRKHYPQDLEHSIESSHAEIRLQGTAAICLNRDQQVKLVILAELQRRSRTRGTESGRSPARPATVDFSDIMLTIRQVVSEQHDLQVDAVAVLAPGSLPKTSSGKLRRHACSEAIRQGSLDYLATWSLPPDDLFSTTPCQAVLP